MVDRERLCSIIDRSADAEEGGISAGHGSQPPPAHHDSSVIELVSDVIVEALRLHASDIHLESAEHNMLVRYRLDGILHQKKTVKEQIVPEVISRIKILAGLDIAEKRRPQDGRIRFKYDDRLVDIRVSALPTNFGEKIVLRLLDKAAFRADINHLGFSPDDLSLLKEKVRVPSGLILITGPTGSGKTTTLYAALNYIKSPDINIVTIEDPVEYNIDGINQTRVRPELGLSFASALRAILRQDPNVIMVGEIRDRETLDNALRASLTGHLVFSTVHTNDAVATITRLIDLGAARYLLGTALKLIVAQRLVRKICPHCTNTKTPQREITAAKTLGLPSEVRIRYGKGCRKCLSIGYWGRTAIYEMLAVDESFGDLISRTTNQKEISLAAGKRGFVNLRKKGIHLIMNGITTPTEVLRETS
jgi:type II secretory ATPase GspE/PulE/Tfp pilus assembly ATPase PilB-like protein